MANQVDIIIRAVDKSVKKVFSDMAGSVKKAETSLDAFNKTIARTNKLAGAITGRMATAFAGIGTGLISKSLFDAGVQAERLNLAFEAISGSTKGAQAELANIRSESDRLGLVFYDTADAYKQIFAAGEAGHVPLEETRKIFRGMAEAAAALGMTEEQATGSMRALGQMMGKNKVLAEELRTQMGEKLPTAIQFMADAFGGSVAELEKAMANGEIGVETIVRFSEILHEKYGAKAEEAAKKAIGALNAWKTAWWDLKVTLAESGFLDESVSQLKRMTTTLKDPAVQAAIKVWAERFFALAGSIIKIAWEWKGWIAGLAGTLIVTSVLTRMVGLVIALHKGFVVLTGVKVTTWLAGLAGGLGKAYGVLTMMPGAISHAMKPMGGFGAILGNAGVALASFGVGWEIGTFLNKFEVVQKAGIAMAGGLTDAWLKTKLAWAKLTGSDTAALEREIKEAESIYFEMFSEVGKKGKQAHDKVADAAEKAGKKEVEVRGSVTKQMISKYQEYVEEIKKLQDEITGREESLAEQLREMSRTGMSDLSAWKDRRYEAQEYEEAAKKAMKAGRFEEAVSYADKAKAAYAGLNDEVKTTIGQLIAMKQAQAKEILQSGWSKGTYQEYLSLQKEISKLQAEGAKDGMDTEKSAISKQEALKVAMDGVAGAGALATEVLKKQQEVAEKSKEALDKQSNGELAARFGEAKEKLDDITVATDKYAHVVVPGIGKAYTLVWDNTERAGKAMIKEIDLATERLTSKPRTMVIDVVTRESRSGGGVIGALQMAAGGMVRHAARMAAGGMNVKNAMNGFHFAGYGGGDQPRNLVMAENGEVMIRKEMVKRAGLRAALAFNSGRFDILLSELMARFNPAGIMMKQMGGLISPARAMPDPLFMTGGGMVAGGGSVSSSVNVNLNLPTAGPPIQTSMNKSQVNELFRQLGRMGELAA